MSNFPVVKVAAVQAAPVFLNLDATVDKTCRLIDEAAAMGSQNEQIHVASWPSFFPGEGELMGIRACELCSLYYALSNQVYVIMSSMIYTDEMRNMLADTEFKQALMVNGYGCTEVIAPNAEVIAKVPRDEEGIAVAEADLNAIIPGKFCTDPTGHYSTPGFLSLTFDQTEHVPVKKIGRASCRERV